MSSKAQLFLSFAVIAFVVAALRFVPSLPISRGITDFATGAGVGLLIGVLVTWRVDRDVS